MRSPLATQATEHQSFSASAEAAVAVEAGTTLNERYRLDREVARTEAGVVFEATDVTLNRRVAVEVASSIEEPRARRKWARDAMFAQRLEGEHVLRVADVGALAGGVPFVVRESVLCTLSRELDARGAIPLPVAVGWTLEACEAVAEAHALGMAHGDLRLDNMYLARGPLEPTVKVAWTSAAKAERAARGDVTRDIAGLGVMLRVLATGHIDVEDDGATTLPSELAHAVGRALADAPDSAFSNVAELARELAPFAPPGHGSARTVAFLISRAGIVGGLPGATRAPASARGGEGAPASERRLVSSTTVDARSGDRSSMTDDWFGHSLRTPVADQVTPPSTKRSLAFTTVSVGLIAAVLGGSLFLFESGKLPRWTGTAPPDQPAAAEVTPAPQAEVPAPSAPSAAQPTVTPAATAAPGSQAVETLPNALPTREGNPIATTVPKSTPPAASPPKPAARAEPRSVRPAETPVWTPDAPATTVTPTTTSTSTTPPSSQDEAAPTPTSTAPPAATMTPETVPAPAQPETPSSASPY